jgi:hypothetical protein
MIIYELFTFEVKFDEFETINLWYFKIVNQLIEKEVPKTLIFVTTDLFFRFVNSYFRLN